MKFKILVITPIKHIKGLELKLKKKSFVKILNDPSKNDVLKIIHKYNAIYTNPNKSKIYIGKEIIDKATNLQFISTASTGTNHIDKNYAKNKNIKIISLTKDIKTINKISSTAEHALCLTLATVRNLIPSFDSVKKGNWDYTKFIGRQMDHLKIGIIGYGRLGKFYAKYCKAFNSKIFVFDPYKNIKEKYIKQVNSLNFLLTNSDIIVIHVHLNSETFHMISKKNLFRLKKNAIIINTSRGEVVDENSIINFLKKNKKAKYACDVIENEINKKTGNELINYSKNSNQIIISPHIGGMTEEAQQIAYHRIADRLNRLI